MRKLELYTGEKSYMTPSSEVAHPYWMQSQYPAILQFPHVIETDEGGEVVFAVMNLSALRGQYNIDTTLSKEDAVVEIERIINMPQPELEPSAEERIASAMEFSNMVAMSNLSL